MPRLGIKILISLAFIGYAVLRVVLDLQHHSNTSCLIYNNGTCKNVTENSTKPIRQFFYHALHKTGSTITRTHLRYRCKEAKIACLTYNFCSKSTNSLIRCFEPIEAILDKGTVTAQRYNKCCKEKSSGTHKFEAIVEHFYMANNVETQKFLQNHLPPWNQLFRFTVLRHPVDQFISYYNAAKPYRRFPSKLSSVVESLYQQAFGNLTINPQHDLWGTFKILANGQTQELTGWDGTQGDLHRSLDVLKSLDFVGIYEELDLVFTSLRSTLGWQASSVFGTGTKNKGLPPPRVSARKNVSTDIVEKITAIQWADMALYNAGRQIWLNYFRPK